SQVLLKVPGVLHYRVEYASFPWIFLCCLSGNKRTEEAIECEARIDLLRQWLRGSLPRNAGRVQPCKANINIYTRGNAIETILQGRKQSLVANSISDNLIDRYTAAADIIAYGLFNRKASEYACGLRIVAVRTFEDGILVHKFPQNQNVVLDILQRRELPRQLEVTPCLRGRPEVRVNSIRQVQEGVPHRTTSGAAVRSTHARERHRFKEGQRNACPHSLEHSPARDVPLLAHIISSTFFLKSLIFILKG